MIRLMTYNIQEGGGDRARQARLLEVIQRASPDVLVLNEAVNWHPQHPFADRIGAALGADYRVAPSASRFDVALFSRFPILKFRTLSTPVLLHSAAWIAVESPAGERLHVVGVHLDFREETLRVREIDALLPHLAPLLETRAALLGDLNAIAPDDPVMGLRPDELAQTDLETMPEWFLNRYPPRAMPRLRAAGWRDSFRLRHVGNSGYTMSTTDPNARYDYILVTPSLAERVEDVHVETDSPASNASDHFAVVADLEG
jgi:endonuclease/exonuclease/phosphatase family metal-dependent hydrolase